jgi:hypothetical protein
LKEKLDLPINFWAGLSVDYHFSGDYSGGSTATFAMPDLVLLRCPDDHSFGHPSRAMPFFY